MVEKASSLETEIEKFLFEREIEKFLYEEARIMDEHLYDEWLTLWTDDALYWVPFNEDDIDPDTHVSIIYEHAVQRAFRVARLKSGSAYAQDPPSKMRRIIGNIEVQGVENGEITVVSNFDITHLRRSHLDIYSGRQLHRLRREDGQLKIAYRKVMLLQNDEALGNLSFLL